MKNKDMKYLISIAILIGIIAIQAIASATPPPSSDCKIQVLDQMAFDYNQSGQACVYDWTTPTERYFCFSQAGWVSHFGDNIP